jgi:hypothetical protein
MTKISDENAPVFPSDYAQRVIDHGKKQQRRHRNPSEPFLEERNPRKALDLAEKVVEKPEGIIRDRLLRLREYMPGQQELVYSFGEYLADHINPDIVPLGFVMAAHLALYDIQQGVDSRTNEKITGSLVGQLPLIYRLLEMEIPLIAKAIFPNDFADQAGEFVDAVNRQVDEHNAKVKAAAPPPVLPEDPLKLYTAARRIADIAIEVWGEAKAFLIDQRKEKVNPFYNQTANGLFIEQYYGIPGAIWTPWGKWDCWGSGSGTDELMEKFLSRIGKVEVAVPVRHTEMGTIGPIYAVLQVGDVVLPKPETRDPLSYIEYEEANRLWAEVETAYRAQAL